MTVLLAALLISAGSWATYHAPHRNDQYQLIQLGECVYHGGKLYVDCWENKPPGIAWLEALGLLATQGRPIGAWFVPVVVEVLVLLVVWLALRKVLGSRTSRTLVLLAALVYSLRLYDTPSINPDFYASLFELAAIALLVRGSIGALGATRVPRWPIAVMTEEESERAVPTFDVSYAACFFAGVFWAAATTVKQVGCVGLLVLSVFGLLTGLLRPRLFGHVVRTWLVTWIGFLLGIAAVGGVLWYQGVLLEAWRAIFAFNSGLLNFQDFVGSARTRLQAQNELTPLWLPLWLALTGLVVSFWHRKFQGFPVSLALGLLLWWAAAVILAGMGPSKAMRYWQATFPPILILAGVGMAYVDQAFANLERPHRSTMGVLAISIIMLLAFPAVREIRDSIVRSLAASRETPSERDRLIEIGNRVKELTQTDDRIYVFDFASGIYVYADRLPAARFTYPRSAEQMNEILTELESGKARLLLLPKKTAPEFQTWCGPECADRLKALGEKCEPKGGVGEPPYFLCYIPTGH